MLVSRGKNNKQRDSDKGNLANDDDYEEVTFQRNQGNTYDGEPDIIIEEENEFDEGEDDNYH